jgi:hypothetical protein
MAFLSSGESDPAARLVQAVRHALRDAVLAEFERDRGIYAIDGMSGARYRHFINGLLRRLGPTSYLEVGSWMGSTLCSAIHGNAVRALAIDNWSQFGGPRDSFVANVHAFRPEASSVDMIEGDFRAVDYASLPQRWPAFEVYLFDGPHAEADQYDGLALALPALADSFVFICDDWNWQPVRAGTARAVADAGLEILAWHEIRTSLDESHGQPVGKASDWHNGYCISVLRKPALPQAAPIDLASLRLQAENAALRGELATLRLRDQALRHQRRDAA